MRAWQRMPHDLDGPRRRAWLRRTASNLAVDEWRRRRRRPAVALEDTGEIVAATAPDQPDAALEALAPAGAPRALPAAAALPRRARATARSRGCSDITEEAARKRVARARAAFVGAYRAARAGGAPVVLVLSRDEPRRRYVRWLREARARERARAPRHRRPSATSRWPTACVITGAQTDLHSELYGERPRALRGETNLERDRDDLAALRGALALRPADRRRLPRPPAAEHRQRRHALPGRGARRRHPREPRRGQPPPRDARRQRLAAPRRALGVRRARATTRRCAGSGATCVATATSEDGVIEIDRARRPALRARRAVAPRGRRARRRGRAGARRGGAEARGMIETDGVTLATPSAASSARSPSSTARDAAGGPVLLAEVDGELLAAISLADGAILADPFRPSAAARRAAARARAPARGRAGRGAGGAGARRRGSSRPAP